jgi:hypothetical protein
MRWHPGGNRRPLDQAILAKDGNLLVGGNNYDFKRAPRWVLLALSFMFATADFTMRLSM